MGHQRVPPVFAELSQAASVVAQRLQESLQAVVDHAVDLVGRLVDELRREVGQQLLELQAFLQRLLRLFAVGDVNGLAQHLCLRQFPAQTHLAPGCDPSLGAIRQNHAVLAHIIDLILDRTPYGEFNRLAVLRMDPPNNGLIPDGRIRWETEHPSPILRGPNLVARNIPHPHARARRCCCQPQTLLALVQNPI